MADINTFYDGVLEYFDPKGDSGIKNPKTVSFIGGFGGSNFWLDQLPSWPEFDQINKDSSSTLNAVKVPYTGTTQADRTQWLNDRLTAINSRVTFIKSRVEHLLNSLQARGSSTYDVLSKGFSSALSLLPGFGPIISYATAQANTAKTIDDYKLQALIQDYTKDLNFLAQLKNSYLAELAKAPTTTTTTVATTTTTEQTSNAPTPIPTWYYYAGAALLILLFVWYRRNH